MSPILPERPLRLRTGFVLRYRLGAIACVAGAAAIGYFGGDWAVGDARKIAHQNELWETGAASTDVNVEGQERSNHFVFYSYDLKVDYRDAKGAIHRADATFDSLWTEVDQAKSPIVHYNPSAPDDFVLSWAIDLGGGRWGAFGVAIFGIFMLTGTLGIVGWALNGQLKNARRCAERSDEVLLNVTSVSDQIVNGTNTGAKIYRYELKGVGSGSGEVIMPKGAAPPLFADAEGTKIVALISPDSPTKPLIVRSDMHPFDFTAEEAAQIRERSEAQRRAGFGAEGGGRAA